MTLLTPLVLATHWGPAFYFYTQYKKRDQNKIELLRASDEANLPNFQSDYFVFRSCCSVGRLGVSCRKEKKKGRKVQAGDAINSPGSSASVGLMSREGCSWFLHLLSPRE